MTEPVSQWTNPNSNLPLNQVSNPSKPFSLDLHPLDHRIFLLELVTKAAPSKTLNPRRTKSEKEPDFNLLRNDRKPIVAPNNPPITAPPPPNFLRFPIEFRSPLDESSVNFRSCLRIPIDTPIIAPSCVLNVFEGGRGTTTDTALDAIKSLLPSRCFAALPWRRPSFSTSQSRSPSLASCCLLNQQSAEPFEASRYCRRIGWKEEDSSPRRALPLATLFCFTCHIVDHLRSRELHSS